ncbi:MAG: hypothetical protein HYV90_02135 [Candidatus Woesebacteria bacterium]|nr:MAG: hypothetical protein HYV90_02135 [Candidatus Woesebacteria bacterium]
MLKLTRSFENPILSPSATNRWENQASFNPSVIEDGHLYHMVYRALSKAKPYFDKEIKLSTIGYANSPDPIHFVNRKQLIEPEYDWEKYGCEDPRITKIDDIYYIFYTALSNYPYNADCIKVGVAITHDFKTIEEKHLVTPFNAKAACLFPEKINGKYAMLITVNPDRPPSKICIAYFDEINDIWSEDYWDKWQKNIDLNKIDLLRDSSHQVEVGAVPIKTKYGWLLIHSYISDYFSSDQKFGIEAVLLKADDPQTILARTTDPLLTPKEQYELFGEVPYVIFPSGAVVNDGILYVYYGAADSVSAVASINLDLLINNMYFDEKTGAGIRPMKAHLARFEGNPIISPRPLSKWEAMYTFNPTAIVLEEKVHILYRAQGTDNVSTLGYANSTDGVTIEERLDKPVYVPREDYETLGCEDPRITRIGDTLYLFYTAYKDGDPTHIAFSTISVDDFLQKKWNWSKAMIVSPREINDKNACVLPEKIGGKYAIFHRTNHRIWIDYTDTMDFSDGRWIQGNILFEPRSDKWYSEKVGITGTPIRTTQGWLLIFHGLSKDDLKYRLGAMLLDLKDPLTIKNLLDYPILEPEKNYEMSGFRPGTVFSCGYVILKDQLLVYYGAGDTTVAVARIKLEDLLAALKASPYEQPTNKR